MTTDAPALNDGLDILQVLDVVRRLKCEIDRRRFCCGGGREVQGLLTVRVTPPAIDPDFARSHLMPGVRRHDGHPGSVDQLEGERRIGRDLRPEARIGVALLVDRRAVPQRNLTQNALAFGNAVPPQPWTLACWFLDQNTDPIDFAVLKEARVPALVGEIAVEI